MRSFNQINNGYFMKDFHKQRSATIHIRPSQARKEEPIILEEEDHFLQQSEDEQEILKSNHGEVIYPPPDSIMTKINQFSKND